MRKELMSKMKYAVDIPDGDNELWKCIEYFETKKEAIKFCQKHFGADNKGRINLVSSL
jgi:hypothetical protein